MNFSSCIPRRAHIDAVIDRIRFALDTLPMLDYQPLPWLGRPKARRALGVESRWERIDALTQQMDVRSAVDIGANVGYFSIALASRDVQVMAIEFERRFFRTLLYATGRLQLENLGAACWKMTPASVSLMPPCDATLFLSVWHHLVRWHGLEQATDMLRAIWARTSRVMFFETGEGEMPARYGLPEMTPDPRSFITDYLERACESAEVVHLGLHAAFAPGGRTVERNLFAVKRADP